MTPAAIRITCGLALSVFSAQVTHALPLTAWQQTEAFALCSGRLAALATQQSALSDPKVQETALHRDNFDQLVDATLPAALDQGVPADQVNRWRSQGWREMANLLADAMYSNDAHISERALQSARNQVQDCQDLIL